MKTTKLVLTLALGGLLISTGALNVAAANQDGSGKTTGNVEYTTVGPNDPGIITKPDTDDEIIEIPEGNHTTGPLRLTFVPNLDFGTMEVKSDTIEGKAKFLDFNKKDETTTAKISHFAQVEDIRGLEDGTWKLNVSATKFEGKNKAGETVKLDNSAVQFNEAKLFNTSYTDIANRVKPMDPATLKQVPNDGTASLEIMRTSENSKGTNSSKTSLVFNKDYTKDEAITTPEAIAAGNSGVTLKSYGKDNKLAGVEYTSVLTWTLTDTL